MARRGQDITDAELGILRDLWRQGPTTIRSLTDVLYPDGGTSAYATVQKLLERLETKGHVTRQRGEGPHVFHPLTQREDLIDRRLSEMAETLCGGSLAPLITRLVERSEPGDIDLEALRALLARLDAEQDPGGAR
jgi:predicted transcriptional regulator